MQVDRAGVHLVVRGAGVDGAEQPAGGRLDDRDRRAAGAAQVDVGPALARVQYQPVGRRAARPAATSASSTAAAGSPPNRARSASVSGSSAAAQHSAAPSTYGLAGSRTVASTGRPNSASGWCTR